MEVAAACRHERNAKGCRFRRCYTGHNISVSNPPTLMRTRRAVKVSKRLLSVPFSFAYYSSKEISVASVSRRAYEAAVPADQIERHTFYVC